MRWDRLFQNLEYQLESERESERGAIDAEVERLRISRLSMTMRLAALVGGPVVAVEAGQDTVRGRVDAAGADFVVLCPEETADVSVLVPAGALTGVILDGDRIRESARTAKELSAFAERITLGFVLRDLARRRVPIRIRQTNGRTMTGTPDRVGADHLDLAVHDAGALRREADVRAHRIVPFSAIAWAEVVGAAPYPVR